MPILSTSATASASLASSSSPSTSSILIFAGIGATLFGIFGLVFYAFRKRVFSVIGVLGGNNESQSDEVVVKTVSECETENDEDLVIDIIVHGGESESKPGIDQPEATVAAPKFVPRPFLLGMKHSANPLSMQSDWRLLTKEAEDRRQEEAMLTDACARASQIRRGRSVARPGQIITCVQAENKRHGVASFFISPVSPDSVDGNPSVIAAGDHKEVDHSESTHEESFVEKQLLEELLAAMDVSAREQISEQVYHPEPELDAIPEENSVSSDAGSDPGSDMPPSLSIYSLSQLCSAQPCSTEEQTEAIIESEKARLSIILEDEKEECQAIKEITVPSLGDIIEQEKENARPLEEGQEEIEIKKDMIVDAFSESKKARLSIILEGEEEESESVGEAASSHRRIREWGKEVTPQLEVQEEKKERNSNGEALTESKKARLSIIIEDEEEESEHVKEAIVPSLGNIKGEIKARSPMGEARKEMKKDKVILNTKKGTAQEAVKPGPSRRGSISASPRAKVVPPKMSGVSSAKENAPVPKISATARSRRLSTASTPLGNLGNTARASNNEVATKVRSPSPKTLTTRTLVTSPSHSAFNRPLAPKTPPIPARTAPVRILWNSNPPAKRKPTGVISSPTKKQVPTTRTPTRLRASSVSSVKPANTKTQMNMKKTSTANLANRASLLKVPTKPKSAGVDKNLLLALERSMNSDGSTGRLASVTEDLSGISPGASGSSALSTTPIIMDGWSSGDDGSVLLTVFEKDIRGIQPLIDPRLVDVPFANLRSFSTTVYIGATLRKLNAYITGKIGGHPGLRGMISHPDGYTTFAPLMRDEDLKKWLARCVESGYDGVLECWLVGEEPI